MAKYRKHSPDMKVRIVLEILRGEKSVAQASREYRIKDSLLYRWREQFLEGGRQAFAYGQPAELKRRADKEAELERLVGKLRCTWKLQKKLRTM